MRFVDILKIIVVYTAMIVGIINIYKLFNKAPTDRKEKTVLPNTASSHFITPFESQGSS
jgi:hypothetical protein